MPLSLLCDEHIPFEVVNGLANQGLDVVTVQDLNLRATVDPDIMSVVRQEGLVIYTNDTDFLRLSNSGVPHPGILYHHPQKFSPNTAINIVGTACQVLDMEEMPNRVQFL